MTTNKNQAEWLEIDQFLEAFEAAQKATSGIDLRDFLPARTHPLYAVILKELIRVDLEHRSNTGAFRSLDNYRQLFPEFFLDPAVVQEVAFEEYRQRRERGERPAPEEYAERYGVETSRWPRSTSLSRFKTRHPSV